MRKPTGELAGHFDRRLSLPGSLAVSALENDCSAMVIACPVNRPWLMHCAEIRGSCLLAKAKSPQRVHRPYQIDCHERLHMNDVG